MPLRPSYKGEWLMKKEFKPRYVGHWLAIRCYKHDGSLHRIWDRGLVLENNDDYLVIARSEERRVGKEC